MLVWPTGNAQQLDAPTVTKAGRMSGSRSPVGSLAGKYSHFLVFRLGSRCSTADVQAGRCHKSFRRRGRKQPSHKGIRTAWRAKPASMAPWRASANSERPWRFPYCTPRSLGIFSVPNRTKLRSALHVSQAIRLISSKKQDRSKWLMAFIKSHVYRHTRRRHHPIANGVNSGVTSVWRPEPKLRQNSGPGAL